MSNDLPYNRNYADKELEEIIVGLDDNELHGLMFGLFPQEKRPSIKDEDANKLTNKDYARLMELNPKGHY